MLAVGRRTEPLQETAAGHERITPLAADITTAGEPERIIHTARELHGHLDVLVNNAGIVRSGALGALAPETITPRIATNHYEQAGPTSSERAPNGYRVPAPILRRGTTVRSAGRCCGLRVRSLIRPPRTRPVGAGCRSGTDRQHGSVRREAGAPAPDGADVEGVVDVGGGVSVHQQQVGSQSLGYASAVVQGEAACRGRGRGPQRVGR